MIITLKDGSTKEYQQAMSVIDIAKDISEGLARMAACGEVDGEVVDLRYVVDQDCTLSIHTVNDPEGLAAYRHTTSHIRMQSWQSVLPSLMDFTMIWIVRLHLRQMIWRKSKPR